jgi:hypothetical protein
VLRNKRWRVAEALKAAAQHKKLVLLRIMSRVDGVGSISIKEAPMSFEVPFEAAPKWLFAALFASMVFCAATIVNFQSWESDALAHQQSLYLSGKDFVETLSSNLRQTAKCRVT